MKRPVLVWSSIVVCYFLLIIYSFRGYYTQPFDASYWKDKYEHSQWKLPLSQRIIGDDGLYLYEGYRLVGGADPSLFNAEVPPLGKYIIGLFTRYLGYPHVYGLITTSLVLVIFFLFCRNLFPDTRWVFLATFIFALDPLLVGQFHLTMLESLQVFFLLLTIYALRRFSYRLRFAWVILAGISIGLFSETKVPIFTPLIFTLSVWYIRRITSGLHHVLLFTVSAIVGYLLPYVQFFLLGHTFVDFLKVQKWIVAFYESSKLSPNIGNVFSTILANQYQNLFTKSFESVPEWSISWPFALVLGFIGLTTNQHMRSVLLVGTGGVLLVLSVIPFWTRYLLIVIPFLYLGAAFFLQKFRFGLIFAVVLIFINGMPSLSVLFTTPEQTVRQFFYNWQHGFFQDMYEDLTGQEKQNTHRAEFHRFGLMRYSEAEVENISVQAETEGLQQYPGRQLVPVTIVYSTRHLGTFTHTIKLPVVLEKGRWKIAWNWSLLFPGLDENKHLETNVIFSRRGTIRAGDNTPRAQDVNSNLIWVTPEKIDRTKEQKLLTYLEKLFGGEPKAIAFHQKIFGNSLPDIPIPLGVPQSMLSINERMKLAAFGGIKFTTHPARIASGDFVGIEKEYNAALNGENGGTLVVKDVNGQVVQTLISRVKRDGKDVSIVHN